MNKERSGKEESRDRPIGSNSGSRKARRLTMHWEKTSDAHAVVYKQTPTFESHVQLSHDTTRQSHTRSPEPYTESRIHTSNEH